MNRSATNNKEDGSNYHRTASELLFLSLCLFCTSLFLLISLDSEISSQETEHNRKEKEKFQKEIQRLISLLDDEKFSVRARATQKLISIGRGNRSLVRRLIQQKLHTIRHYETKLRLAKIYRKIAGWIISVGGDEHEFLYSVLPDENGSILLAGYTRSFGNGSNDFWFVSLSSDGSLEWQKTLGGPDSERFKEIVRTEDGGYILTGTTRSFGAGKRDILVVKLTESFEIEWQKVFGGASEERFSSIQPTSDGGYILGARTKSFGSGREDFWIVKLKANGAVEWEKVYGGEEDDDIYSIRETPDGGYVAGGQSNTYGNGHDDYWILKLDENGKVEWQNSYGGTDQDHSRYMDVLENGHIVLGGNSRSFGRGGYDLWLICVNQDGSVVWQRTYGGRGNEGLGSFEQLSNGGYVIGGRTDSAPSTSDDYVFLRTDPDRDILHQRGYGGDGDEYMKRIKLMPDGGFVLGGTSESFSMKKDDFWVVKTDPKGVSSSFGKKLKLESKTTSVKPNPTSCKVSSTRKERTSLKIKTRARVRFGESDAKIIRY